MSQKHFMIAINWYGPYMSIDDASEVAKCDFGYGLYMGIGKCAHERRVSLQYVGISESLGQRISSGHHKLLEIKRDFELVGFADNLDFKDIFVGFNKFVFTYNCLTNFLSIPQSVVPATKKRLGTVLYVNFILQFIVVMGIAIMSYL